MTVVQSRPSTLDVTVTNPNEFLYVKGSEFVNGSRRFVINNDGVISSEERTGGVWNVGPLEVGGGTIFLDKNISLAGIGSSLEIRSLEGERTFIAVDAEFNDDGSRPPRSVLMGELIPRLILQPIFSEQDDSTTFLRAATIGPVVSGFGSVFYLKTGTVGATAPVTIQISGGLVPGGPIFFSEEFPTALFAANTEVVIPLSTPVGFFSGQDILNTVSSDNTFSLLGDTAGEFWVAFDFQFVEFEQLLPHPSGTDRMLSDGKGNILVDMQGNLIVRQFAFPELVQNLVLFT